MIEFLPHILYVVSNALLVPVIVLLMLFMVLTLIYFGGLTREALDRCRRRPAFAQLVRKAKSDPSLAFTYDVLPPAHGLAAMALREPTADRAKMLNDIELESERLLGKLALGIRLGPMLGLAGTLIPLGPALVALSSGDIATLSAKLVVAFTTTVIGILIGGGCFAMHSVRRHWYMQDINDIEFIFGRLHDDQKNS